MVTPLHVLQALGSAASLIAGAHSLLSQDHKALEEKIDDVMRELWGIRSDIVTATTDILEAIEGIRLELDEDVAYDCMARADRALYNDLLIFGDCQEAMGSSYESANRIGREESVGFAGPLMYVANIRMIVTRSCVRESQCNAEFRDEFRFYARSLERWAAELDSLIRSRYSVTTVLMDIELVPNRARRRFWLVRLMRGSAVRESFSGPDGDLGEDTRRDLERQAQGAMRAAIDMERRTSGVVELESTAKVWRDAFASLECTLRELGLDPLVARAFGGFARRVGGESSVGEQELLMLAGSAANSPRAEAWRAFLRDRSDAHALQRAARFLVGYDLPSDDVEILHALGSRFGAGSILAALIHSKQRQARERRREGAEP